MNFPKTRLGNIADFNNGVNFNQTSYKQGVKLIGVSDFGERFSPNIDSLAEIEKNVVADNALLKNGDIVFVRSNGNKALVGRCMLIKEVEEPVTFSGFCIRARFKNLDQLAPEFFAYYFKSQYFRKSISGSSVGTNIQNLNQSILKNTVVPLPDFDVQKRISKILSSYDDLIENNQKQIKLLEEAAQRLYKEWFVDLRFPGYEQTKIVDGVPEGWTIETLSAIADIVMGQSPKSEFYNSNKEGLPFHQGVGSYGERFVNDEIFTTSFTRIAESFSVLFSVRAPVGRINITQNRIVIGRGLAALTHKKGFQSFLYYMLKEFFFKEDIIGNGAIFASISKEELYSLLFLNPSIDIVK